MYLFNKIKNTKYLIFFFFFFDKPNVTVVYCLILKRFVTCFAFWWWIRVFKTIQNKFYFQSTFLFLLFTIQIFLKILRGANSLSTPPTLPQGEQLAMWVWSVLWSKKCERQRWILRQEGKSMYTYMMDSITCRVDQMKNNAM